MFQYQSWVNSVSAAEAFREEIEVARPLSFYAGDVLPFLLFAIGRGAD